LVLSLGDNSALGGRALAYHIGFAPVISLTVLGAALSSKTSCADESPRLTGNSEDGVPGHRIGV
jgi:hypothetical protein